jgi:hypothetical protein
MKLEGSEVVEVGVCTYSKYYVKSSDPVGPCANVNIHPNKPPIGISMNIIFVNLLLFLGTWA